MTDTQQAHGGLASSDLKHILWRCNECDSFISTHSLQIVQMVVCPVCLEAPLKYCGTFESITGSSDGDSAEELSH
jgi:hypothetical protein